jgi:hypothetical protein
MSNVKLNDPLYLKYLERMNRNPNLQKKCICSYNIAEELRKYLEKDIYEFRTLPMYLWIAGLFLFGFAIACTYLIITFFDLT